MYILHRCWIPVLAALLGLVARHATAQESRHPGRSGPRSALPIADEIALARSAAPASVSDAASIWVFTDTGYVLAERGTNGAACYVSRSWPDSIEPHCFDAEGAETIMRIHMHEVMLLHRGLTPDAAVREIGAALAEGKWRLPRRPVISYMMSAGQRLISDDGRPVGAWRPHVMIYYPGLEGPVTGAAADLQAGVVSDAGTPLSSIMFLVPDAVPVRRPANPR